MKKKNSSNRSERDNSSVVKGKSKLPDTISPEKEKDFQKSKLRNKGKASKANPGGSLSDQKSMDKKKRRLM
jgi:hypothetical protein